MYNIDLSFLKGKNIEEALHEEEYNNKYHNQVINCIKTGCKNPEHCFDVKEISSKFENIVDGNFMFVECKGLVGDHFVKILQPESNLQKGDFILVEFEDCTEIAKVVENGEIANYLYQTHDKEDLHLSKYLRRLTEEDENQFKRNMFEEVKAREVFKEKIKKHNLDMKLVDVHWQFDRKKIYFYYTAEGRVDFRELAKDLAGLYKTRIELRQIGVRDEAKRVGGLGTCGREYCCVSFMNNFKRISSQSANEQNPAVSMSKLSGPCGKLKCCLSFETENN